MTAGQLYAVVTSITGVILLLVWLYVTTNNARSNEILFKSVFLFVLPGAILVALPLELFHFPLSMWVVVLIEELLKTAAAATERERMDRFSLVALFGVWELMLAKPLWGLNQAADLESWSNLQLAGLAAAGIVTVLMHAVTAEIYAFRFAGRLGLALLVSWVVHTSFNEAIDLLDVSLVSCLALTLPLVLTFAALWPRGSAATQSSSSS